MTLDVIKYAVRTMARWESDAEGRLIKAAISLFDEQGFQETTVAQIADAAGLTKRTFFRYFADKREVLFNGSHELQERWLAGIAGTAPDASPMAAALAGLDAVADLFTDRLPFAATRSRIVAANPELQERELIKLQNLAAAIETALRQRGIADNTAALAAQAGIAVFHVGFARWVAQPDPAAFRRLMAESLTELQSVVS